MLGAILSALTGGVAKELAGAFKAREQAKTDAERIKADERIAELQAIRDVQKAEAGTPVNAIIRGLFALPVAAYYGKIFLIDKALGWGRTDPLSDELWWVAMTIIGFYFIRDAVGGLARMRRR